MIQSYQMNQITTESNTNSTNKTKSKAKKPTPVVTYNFESFWSYEHHRKINAISGCKNIEDTLIKNYIAIADTSNDITIYNILNQ